MSNPTRANAINVVAGLHAPAPEAAAPANINYYAEDVFNTDAMREYLPKATAEKLLSTINNGAPLDADIAAEKKKAAGEIKDEISEIAIMIAEKVVEREITPEDHQRLIADFIDRVGEER